MGIVNVFRYVNTDANNNRLRLKQSHPRLKQEVLAFVKRFVLVLPLRFGQKMLF